jgi:hypothetical protein
MSQLVGYGELPGDPRSPDIALRRILVLRQQPRHPDPRARAIAGRPIDCTWIAPVLLLALPLAALLMWVDAPLVLSGVIWPASSSRHEAQAQSVHCVLGPAHHHAPCATAGWLSRVDRSTVCFGLG